MQQYNAYYRYNKPVLQHQNGDQDPGGSMDISFSENNHAQAAAHGSSWLPRKLHKSHAPHYSTNSTTTTHYAPSMGFYKHYNYTEDNLVTMSSREPVSNLTLDRRIRMNQIYGNGPTRNQSANGCSGMPSASRKPRVPHMATDSATYYGSTGHSVPVFNADNSQYDTMQSSVLPSSVSPESSASVSSTSSITSYSSLPPFAPELSQLSRPSQYYKMTEEPTLPHQVPYNHEIHIKQAPNSAPVSAYGPMKKNLSINDMINLPDPLGVQSAPPSPTKSFNISKYFGRSSRSSNPSRMLDQSKSPSLASRIGFRISSGFNSRLSSRLGSRMSNHSSLGTNNSGNVYSQTVSVPVGLEDCDAEYLPRYLPSYEVVNRIRMLVPAFVSQPNPDTNLRRAPQNLQNLMLTAPDQEEVKGFVTRGIYYYDMHCGTTDENGNYNHRIGEQMGFRYRVEGILGKGSFGKVLKCRDFKSGRMVAVKVNAKRVELKSQVRIEAGLLRSLLVDHKGNPEMHHFVRLIEYFEFRGHFCVATEILGLNLYEVLKNNNQQGLGEPTTKYITRQLCEGLEFLGSQGIIHCDLKPENILISDIDLCQVKIVDFGSSCYEGKRLYTYIQSRFYRAPEILLGMPYDVNIDMWSLGAIVTELLVGKPLFSSTDEKDHVALICQVLGSPDPSTMRKYSRAAVFFHASGIPLQLQNSKGEFRGMPGSTPLPRILKGFSFEAIDFIENILHWLPQARLTARKAVFHPFVLNQ